LLDVAEHDVSERDPGMAICLAVGMSEGATSLQRTAASREGLSKTAEQSERERIEGEPADPGVMTTKRESERPVAADFADRQSLRDVPRGGPQPARVRGRGQERGACWEEGGGVCRGPREGEQLPADLERLVDVPAEDEDPPLSPEGGKRLRHIAEPVGELSGASVGAVHLGGREAACGEQDGSQTHDPTELLAVPLGTIGEG